VIGLVLLWSGNKREKTVFDKYLVSFRGLSISCNNLDLSTLFFKEVLEFKEESSYPHLFILPDRSSVQLQEGKDLAPTSIDIRLRVRNGIYKLHEKLSKRVSTFSKDHGTAGISNYEKSDSDIHFTITDPSGLKFTFYQVRVFSKG